MEKEINENNNELNDFIKEVPKKNNKKKKILIIILILTILVVCYSIYYMISLNKAKTYYNKYQFYDAGYSCKNLISFFNKDVKIYKIAREYGCMYQYYLEHLEKFGKEEQRHIQEELENLMIGLYWNRRNYADDVNKYSKEEKDTIQYLDSLFYDALKNEFGISKDTIDYMLNTYDTRNASIDLENIRKELEKYSKNIAESYEEIQELRENPLVISNTKLSFNSSYSILEGSITNNGFQTVYFIKIKVQFMERNGKTIDTNWTYAVGSEGLAPGETTKFKTSVEKDYSIVNAYPSVIDFDY